MQRIARLLTVTLLPACLSAQALSLDEAIRLATRRDAVVRDVEFDVARADAVARVTRAGLLPTIALRGSGVRRVVNPDVFGLPGLPARATDAFTVLDARATTRVPLVDVAALRRWRAARRDVEAVAAAGTVTVQRVALQAAAAYLRAARAEAVHVVRMGDVALAGELLRISRDRVAAGLAPNLDATRAAARSADAEAQAAESDAGRRRARIDLEIAIGSAADAGRPLAASLDALAADTGVIDAATATGLARTHRAEVRAADALVEAARMRSRAVGAEWLPGLNLVGDVGSIGRSGNDMVKTWQAGIEVTLPLFDGLSRQSRSDANTAAMQTALLDRAEVLRTIDLEVRGALADRDALIARERAAREYVRFGELEVEQAESRFTAGVAGNGDVVLALASLSRAHTALTDALTARAAARIALDAATGVLTENR